jgi:hypothetical protein
LTYYTAYKNAIDALVALLGTVSSIKQVVVGDIGRVQAMPVAVINPGDSPMLPADMGRKFTNAASVEIMVIVREMVSTNWLADIMGPLGSVVDAICGHRTLNSATFDIVPVSVTPGRIQTKDHLYQGGVVKAIITFYSG